jgi:hypothetical protein
VPLPLHAVRRPLPLHAVRRPLPPRRQVPLPLRAVLPVRVQLNAAAVL